MKSYISIYFGFRQAQWQQEKQDLIQMRIKFEKELEKAQRDCKEANEVAREARRALREFQVSQSFQEHALLLILAALGSYKVNQIQRMQ